ncbi:MAG TPA: Wzz/FepE/Etk N-terminal domain-containing protein [Candidatus Eisenbacteria bacterium]|nr:Wzz/FepE/Etk N-terminal domain-containing protein [Candidatus Eisenbacteria bacterium]
MDRTIALAPYWERIWARRGMILTLVLTATVVVGAISFVMPPWYRAEVELLPPTEDDSGLGIASLLKGVGVPGVKIPTEVSPAEVFMVILRSRRINEQMVDRFDLKRLYKKKLIVDAVKELLQHSRFKLTAAGTIQITVEDRSRDRAAKMANTYVELLDQFNRETRMTKGRRTRLFIQGRLDETRRELASAEQTLAQYQVKNKAVVLSSQMSSAVDQAARLYARRMALQVRLGVVRGYSAGSEEELQIRQELAQLDRQMRELPETGLELARLVREVKALEQVFALLTAQYEDARITEARDIVTVEVLDRATPPERKSRPRRGIMIAGTFLASLVLGAGYAALKEEERPRPMVRAVGSD